MYLISRYQALSAQDPSRMAGLDINQIAAQRLNGYAQSGSVLTNQDRFPAVTIGAALGGAAAHLALSLGGPFLPHAFVFTLAGGAPDGDVQVYFQRSHALAQHIASTNPQVRTIQHFDPVHDGWLTRRVNHLRLKLLDIPATYQDFIRRRLEPGGAICFLDCQAQWLHYRVGERSVFQVGGWGDIPADEFIQGSARLQEFCRRTGLAYCDWRLPEFPLEQGSESEWGVEPAFTQAVEAFCKREGYRFVPIRFPEPHDFSRLAYHAVEQQIRLQGQDPAGVFIEMFSQFDAYSVIRGGLLPLWLVFNTRDSLEFLERMIPIFPRGKPVFFSPLSTFTITPDLALWSAWETALSGLGWRNIGARPSHYPADAAALASWTDPLRRWVNDYPQPIEQHLTAEGLLEIASRLGVGT